MTKTNRLTIGAAVAALTIGLALGGTAAAQTTSDQEHNAHHPGGTAAPASPAPAPAQAPRAGVPGMTGGQGMPVQGGPGAPQGGMPGMMGGDMGRRMEMMQRQMSGPGMMGGPGAMSAFRHVEGVLAYIRAELRITDAQQPQWNAFADAVRANMDKLRQAYAQAMQSAGQPATAPEQMERRIALLSAQLDAARSLEAAARPLYAALSDEQKRSADELTAEHFRSMRGMPMRGMMP